MPGIHALSSVIPLCTKHREIIALHQVRTEPLELQRIPKDGSFAINNDSDKYYRSLQKALWKVRTEKPGFLFAPAHYEFGDGSFEHELFVDYAFKERDYLEPLVISGRNGRFTYDSNCDGAAHWLVARSACHFSCQSLYLHEGREVRLSEGFPAELSGAPNFMATVTGSVKGVFPGLELKFT